MIEKTVIEKDGTLLTVRPVGPLDTATSPVLRQKIEPEMEGVTDIVMDFEEVEYISSGGLRLLLLTEQEMENRSGTLTVTHVNDHVRSILDMSGFLMILKVV